MSPSVVRTRARRRILLPFAVGLNAVGTAVLLWLDAQKSLALKYGNESVDTPFNDGSDRPLDSNKSGAQSEPFDATKSNEKDIANADTNSNLPVTDVDSGTSKPPAVDANADFQGRDVLVVGSSTPPQILAGPAPTKLVTRRVIWGQTIHRQYGRCISLRLRAKLDCPHGRGDQPGRHAADRHHGPDGDVGCELRRRDRRQRQRRPECRPRRHADGQPE